MLWAANGSAQKRPNIIVFIADDMGWEESTPYGNNYIHTPNISRLAGEGMRFDNFYLTASSCSPSRVSIMTSLYPHNTGAMNLHENVSENIQIFPSVLKDAGYYTMLSGKLHGMNTPGNKKKFDYMDMVNWNKPWEMGEMWLKALNQRPKDKPFFLWAASIDPHRPFRQGDYPYKHDPDSVTVPPYYPDIPELRQDLADYYDEIGRFDEHIGMVLKYLKENNEIDNTIILVISDNGKAFPQCKTRVNVQGLRSPLIVRYPPLVKKNSSSESLISAIDLAPTLLELAGAKKMAEQQGMSFVPVLKNPVTEVRQYAFGEHNWHSYMAYERVAISNNYLYIRNWLPELPGTPPGEVVPTPFFQEIQQMNDSGWLEKKYADCFLVPRPAEELFAYKKDRHCMHSLVEDKKQEAAFNKMRNELEKWLKKTNDFFPGKEKLRADLPDRKTGKVKGKETEG